MRIPRPVTTEAQRTQRSQRTAWGGQHATSPLRDLCASVVTPEPTSRLVTPPPQRGGRARRASPGALICPFHSLGSSRKAASIGSVVEPGHPVGPLEADGGEPGPAVVEHALEVPLPDPRRGRRAAPRAHRRPGSRCPCRRARDGGRAARAQASPPAVRPRDPPAAPDRGPPGPAAHAPDPAEALAELVQPVAPNREPRSHLVPAVALQQIAAGEQRRVQIEPRDAPARSLADVAVERDEEGGPAVSLHHPRRDDPHHAGMPSLAGQHEGRVARRRRSDSTCASASSSIRWSSAWRSTLRPSRRCARPGRFGGVVGEEESKAVGGVADPARRVESGARG